MNIRFQVGISDRQIDQLIQYSLSDEDIKKYTSDRERFKNRESFEKWRNKDREIYTLINEKGDLLGIIWLGKKEIPGRSFVEEIDKNKYPTSFAIRIYGEARGKGLAINFMKKCIKSRDIWLEVSDDNLAAKTVYTKFGFRQVSKPDKNKKIIMVL